MSLNPNLSDPWIQTILDDAEIVPREFMIWTIKHNLHKMDIVPQQKFYSLVWKYYHRFKTWPSLEICEILLETAIDG